jgi:uncharacterized protein (TIGR03083 family)
MTDDRNLATITSEGQRLLAYARRDPVRIVPQYPIWTLTDLVTHTASMHGRTLAVCATRPLERIPAPQLPAGLDPFEWYDQTLRAMVDALREADPDAEVWSLIPERTLKTWERRMVIETAIHRWDAQQAFEDPDPLPPIVATHGLDEFADLWLPRLGTVPVLDVTASDLDRSWRYGRGDPAASVTGLASDLYLRLMARAGARLPDEWERAVDGLATPAGQG